MQHEAGAQSDRLYNNVRVKPRDHQDTRAVGEGVGDYGNTIMSLQKCKPVCRLCEVYSKGNW